MTRMLYLSLLLLLALPARALNPDGFETFIHIGHVFARSTVTNDDGAPLWAEYNDDGGHVRLRSLDGQYGDVYASSYDSCIGYGAFPPGNDHAAFSAQQYVRGVVTETPENITTFNYAVGINVLSGNTLLVGADIGDQTTYSAEVSPETLYAVADD